VVLAGRGQVTEAEPAAPGATGGAPGRTTRRRYAIMLTTAAVVIAVDHLTKWLVTSHIALGQQVPATNTIVNIHYIQNSGAAFGLFPQFTYFYVVVAVIVAGYILVFGPSMGGGLLRLLALGCVLGGAVSDGVDRLLFGHVIDFIDFHFWPVFNAADMAIVGGILVVVYQIGFGGAASRTSGRPG
jgi:signal peptidase II